MTRGAITVTVDQVVELIQAGGVWSETTLATSFGVHHLTIRRKLEGAVARGEVMYDDYSEDGVALTRPHWRYAAAEGARPKGATR
jgi:response regulator of citrate/malate metabolism